MEPNTDKDYMSNIEIRYNILRTHLLAFPSGGPGEIDNVYIHHNEIRRSGTPLLYVASNGGVHERTNYRFEDNVHTGSGSQGGWPAIRFTNVRNASVKRNSIPRKHGDGGAVGFIRTACHDIVIEDNDFTNHPVAVGIVTGKQRHS